MFGFGKNLRKNHLIKRFKELVDYVSSGAHLNNPNNYDYYGQQSKLCREILSEFSIDVDSDIKNQRDELVSMFKYLRTFNHKVQKYGIPYDIAIATNMSIRTFTKNTDEEVKIMLIETCPEYADIARI